MGGTWDPGFFHLVFCCCWAWLLYYRPRVILGLVVVLANVYGYWLMFLGLGLMLRGKIWLGFWFLPLSFLFEGVSAFWYIVVATFFICVVYGFLLSRFPLLFYNCCFLHFGLKNGVLGSYLLRISRFLALEESFLELLLSSQFFVQLNLRQSHRFNSSA